MASRKRQTTFRPAQRKYLRGPVIDAGLRAATERRIEGLPESAFAGERMRSFIAVSSWFWHCYTCAHPEEASEPDSPSHQ